MEPCEATFFYEKREDGLLTCNGRIEYSAMQSRLERYAMRMMSKVVLFGFTGVLLAAACRSASLPDGGRSDQAARELTKS